MSNVAHYELEARLKTHVDGLGPEELRALVKFLIDRGSVSLVHEIAAVLKAE